MAIKFIVNFIAGLGYIKTENFLSKEWTRGEEILNLVSRNEIIEKFRWMNSCDPTLSNLGAKGTRENFTFYATVLTVQCTYYPVKYCI